MKRVCAWHKKHFGFELVMEDGDPEHVTHGMCPECEKIENDIIKERKQLIVVVSMVYLGTKVKIFIPGYQPEVHRIYDEPVLKSLYGSPEATIYDAFDEKFMAA